MEPAKEGDETKPVSVMPAAAEVEPTSRRPEEAVDGDIKVRYEGSGPARWLLVVDGSVVGVWPCVVGGESNESDGWTPVEVAAVREGGLTDDEGAVEATVVEGSASKGDEGDSFASEDGAVLNVE